MSLTPMACSFHLLCQAPPRQLRKTLKRKQVTSELSAFFQCISSQLLPRENSQRPQHLNVPISSYAQAMLDHHNNDRANHSTLVQRLLHGLRCVTTALQGILRASFSTFSITCTITDWTCKPVHTGRRPGPGTRVLELEKAWTPFRPLQISQEILWGWEH